MKIHETAIIHPDAVLGENVEIGPYSIVEENVEIGSGTKVGPYVHLEGWTTIGKDCVIFTGATIGNESKDLKYVKGDRSFVIIGDRNVIREYASISRATGKDDITEIGDDNLLMTYVHIAHDCKIGNRTILASFAAVGGHVTVEDRAIIGAKGAIHQFVRVGTMALAGACAKVVQDIPPYTISDGYPAEVRGLNVVGLRRNGIPPETRALLKKAYKILFRSNLNRTQALEKIIQEVESCPEIEHLVDFIKNSDRGIGV
ncbi:acyl-ACP--UDP-N-acetylglucosamine O-acyltransferase [Candidatus Poribacteria bacterium]|nr:acyl-ACP--UDP-N-acetylglucosamine O-acyltransferase [Candidatus Poribacteria bacterium]